ncbi:trans-aconitate 2-methyltransferase [Actinoplanes sp. M2I2]|uniref:class I SAM-dependent methyltransferase n=1 Tax=Actinoplanes sp. M2I2 TaxID=1734444 RepID=UPI0020219CDB|nr:class I SAM-dependent methyltransferase [Actinoplanes sp. M2I2]
MVQVFGEVAALYDEVRPGYPEEVRQAILDYGGRPTGIVELGAGTGKGTELLVAYGEPVVALEPDPRMAALLRAKFPQVEVVETTFEEWSPPARRPSLVACALAWHWMDVATRNRRSFDTLAPGGTLAIFGHKYGYADPAQEQAITDVFHRVDPTVADRADHWVRDDVAGAGLWSDVEECLFTTYPDFSTQRYLELVQTFSPFRRHTPDEQRRTLDGLRAAVDSFGGSVTLALHTSLVLARKN